MNLFYKLQYGFYVLFTFCMFSPHSDVNLMGLQKSTDMNPFNRVLCDVD